MAKEGDKLQLELASFRQEWHEELLEKDDDKDTESEPNNNEREQKLKPDDPDEKAVQLFLKGVELERKKKLFEAISFYKQAFHLCPDVESKIADQNIKSERAYVYLEDEFTDEEEQDSKGQELEEKSIE